MNQRVLMEDEELETIENKNEYMTPEQLAKRLGVSLRMVREMYYSGAWPHLRLNKRTVRFTEAHLEEIIRMSERRPTSKIRKTTTSQKAAELAELLNQRRPA